jgi:LysM repeat protein
MPQWIKKTWLAAFVVAAAASPVPSLAAPQPPRTARDRLFDDLLSDVSDLKQKVHCFQVEREIMEEKLAQQEQLVNSLKQQLKTSQTAGDELANGRMGLYDKRLASVEKVNEGLVADLKVLKAHGNEMAASLHSLQEQVDGLEKSMGTNMAHMKNALEALAKVSGVSAPSSENGSTYRVKAGDSLEKIARAHQISVDTLKKLNNLSSDRIKIGQNLIVQPK